MSLNFAAFLDSLSIMGLGMLGIFIVVAVLIAVMVLLTKVFRDKAE